MRLRGAIPAAAAIAAIGAVSAGAKGPTPNQVQNAVRAAERSSDLWATINLCNTSRYPHELGLRGQMPSLGFSADLYMRFEVYYRAGAHFGPLARTRQRVYLGRQSGSSVHQAGVTFSFTPPAVLEGKITFTWKRNRTVLGQIARRTTAHHKHVDFGDPAGHSAARCTIT